MSSSTVTVSFASGFKADVDILSDVSGWRKWKEMIQMWAEDEDSDLWDVICGTGSISIALKAEQAKPSDARDEDKIKDLLADAKWSKWIRKVCTYIHLTCDSDIHKKWGTSTTAYVRFAALATSFEDQSFAACFQLHHHL
jgi:hypothetical protein